MAARQHQRPTGRGPEAKRDAKGHYIKETPVEDPGVTAALQASVRPDLRPEMRAAGPHEESSRDRAARRAAEIMGHLDGALDEGDDELTLDSIEIPDGWTYEWKRQTVFGKSDPSYDTRLAKTGWEPVPSSRHPAMMPKGHRGVIERDGLVLMERPKEITDRVKKIMYDRARGAVRLKEQQLNEGPPGTFERVDERGRPMVKVKTTHSPVEIPVPTE